MARAITAALLQTLGVGFRANFQTGLDAALAENMWSQIATPVPSETGENEYGWLGDWPGLREWIGERIVKELSADTYKLRNRKFESTVGVIRDHIEDDNVGLYAPRMEAMGRASGIFWDQLTFEALLKGFDLDCYDGQRFFDAEHPVENPNGPTRLVSNRQDGAGQPWFLMDLRQPLKPLILQQRTKPEFQSKTDPGTSDAVFMRDQYLYGTRVRGEAGYGFWQMAFGSRAELNEENLDAAYDAMASQRNDEDRPLGVMATHLVTGPRNRKAADEVLKRQRKANGADNTNQNLVEVVISPWLLAA